MASEQHPVIWDTGEDFGDTVVEVEASVMQWLAGKIQTYDFVQRDTVLKDPNRRWRVSSAWQKAIRRGNVEVALRMVEGLYSLDPEYPWRRINVIALEDIGIADLALVAAITWVSGKKSWRKNNGGDRQFLYMLVTELCLAVKDRSVCDLVIWVDCSPDFAEKRAAMAVELDKPIAMQLGHLIVNQKAFLADRMLAAWQLAGTKAFPGQNVPENLPGSFIGFQQIVADVMKFPMVIACITRWAASKMSDALPIAFPLVWEMAMQTKSPSSPMTKTLSWEQDDPWVQMPMIGNYPSEAFDWHCREGKRALKYFNKACAPMAEFFTSACKIDPDDWKQRMTATADLVFRVEGSLVDKRLVFDGSKDLFDLAEVALNAGSGVPALHNDWGMELMRANMALMHYARLKILDFVPPGGADKTPAAISVMQPGVTDAGVFMHVKGGKLQLDYPVQSSALAPGHTDLMVSPEAIETLVGEGVGDLTDIEIHGPVFPTAADQKAFQDAEAAPYAKKKMTIKLPKKKE